MGDLVEFGKMFAGMFLFAGIAVWIHALRHTWRPESRNFSARIFFYENRWRFGLCATGLILFSLATYFYREATDTVVNYLGFSWATGANAALGFLIGTLSVVVGPTTRHPLRDN